MESLYTVGGPNSFDSTSLTGGPWRPDAQHGGPPAALLARMIETVEGPHERVARLSVELIKPVPLARLEASVSRSQASRRVSHATATLETGGTIVAKATALLLATAELPEPDWHPAGQRHRLDDAEPIVAPVWASGDNTAFHRDAVEHRLVDGDFTTPGPAVEWIRLRCAVVEGERPSSLCRVAAAADIASGISSIYRAESGVGLINADLTIALHRPLMGEWVGIDALTEVGPDGIGLCSNRLFDEDGTFGSATQSLIGWQTS